MSSITREIIRKLFGGPSVFGFEIGYFQRGQRIRPVDETSLLQATASDDNSKQSQPKREESVAAHDDSPGDDLAHDGTTGFEDSGSVSSEDETNKSNTADATSSDDLFSSERRIASAVGVRDERIDGKPRRKRRSTKIANKVRKLLLKKSAF